MRTPPAAWTWSSVAAVVAALVLLTGGRGAPPLNAQAGTVGQWRTVATTVPINPVHAVLLRTGQVLIVAGSGNVAEETNFRAALWDPASETFSVQALAWDMFCNGMVVLPDGRVFINGGNLQYDPFFGEPRNAVFDPITGVFTDVENMAHGRWYPTTTVLGDGRVMSFSGLRETGGTNTAVEIYTPGTGWSAEFAAGWTPPLYPRMHLLSNGKVFYAGSTRSSRLFDPVTNTWSGIIATTNHSSSRSYGTSVLLPLMPADGYRSRVMIFGGSNPSTPTTEIIDAGAATPQWQFGPPMSQPRIQMNATILPNGKVLATGGSRNDEDALTASLNADIYDPVTNTFGSGGANSFPRLYHSNALLMPDATVLLMGGNPQRGNYESRLEIYSPAYLFDSTGAPALRPTITNVTQDLVGYGGSFAVETPDTADIGSIVLVRPGAPTHAFDMEQRLVGLSFTAGAGVLNVTAPPTGTVAPPGYYMLFLLNRVGVPSVARFVKIGTAVPNQPPVATMTAPAANVTVNPGGTVAYAGTGSDPDGTVTAYSWTFPGGVPASSTAASPGGVSYSTPGAYVTSFHVTDDDGLASSPKTRTVTVSDFSLSATPASRTIIPGGSTTYTATVGAVNGFTGTVGLTVAGLPAGATATFSPSSIVGSGSSTLTVSTSASTPTGSYPITITGTSGPRTRTVAVTLVVNGDFSITATPASRTISKGGIATYNVAITGGTNFTGTVALTVSGAPTRSTSVFTPASVVNSGTSVLTVDTMNNVQRQTRTLTITGTGGGRVHSVTVTLIVR